MESRLQQLQNSFGFSKREVPTNQLEVFKLTAELKEKQATNVSNAMDGDSLHAGVTMADCLTRHARWLSTLKSSQQSSERLRRM